MIRMTRLADYSVMVMTRLAYTPDETATATDIARDTGLPFPTASKIMGAMARAGLLTSHRGLKGGFSLARSPAEITAGDIISAVEGPIAVTECIDDSPGDCNLESLCPTRGHWQRINEAIKTALDRVTLDDLAQPIVFPTPEKLSKSGSGVERSDTVS